MSKSCLCCLFVPCLLYNWELNLVLFNIILTSCFSGNVFFADVFIDLIKLIPWLPLYDGLKSLISLKHLSVWCDSFFKTLSLENGVKARLINVLNLSFFHETAAKALLCKYLSLFFRYKKRLSLIFYHFSLI